MFSLLAICSFSQSNLTLTRAGQEPVVGDVYATQEFDSVGVVPKSTGINQVWNFSSDVQNTNTALSIYVSTVAVPASSTFPGTTLVEDQGAGNYNMWKSATTPTTQWELLGSINTSTTPANGVKFTNSAIAGIWPMLPGATYTDNFTGNVFGLPLFGTGNVVGNQTVSSSGSGTITLPNGMSYSDIVQIKVRQTYTANISVLTFSIKTIDTTTQYMYFHASQKFQLLQVNYGSTYDGTVTTKSFQILANKNITIGLKDNAFSNSFSFFPNPANDKLRFNLSNSNNQNCEIEIYNLTGQMVLNQKLGNASQINQVIEIGELAKGTYILKTKLGNQSESRRLLVE